MHAIHDQQEGVKAAVAERVGMDGRLCIPGGVDLEDGLSEAEAVRLALTNNAAFQELLADLGLAHSDLVQAGLLPNPEVIYYFPTDFKPYKYLVDFPIDAVILRPARVRAATADWERAHDRLTQAGLDLVRDTRLAHADWALARERIRIAEENRQLRERIASLTESRFKAGDATPLELSTAKVDSLRAGQELTRAINDLPFVEERLRNLLGLGLYRPELKPQPVDAPVVEVTDIEPLVAEAIAHRPDVLSAQRAIDAADARIGLAKLGWLRFLGIGDATSGVNGHEFAPAFRVGIPIFNWNEGAITRGMAEREQSTRRLQTVRERVAQEVRQANALYSQAAADYRVWTGEIRPAVQKAIRQAENTYKEGGTSLLLVLETTRQLIDTRTREAQLRADLAKAWAELERAVGRKLGPDNGFASEREPLGEEKK
jgi:cobalt-zinc-cadmium efflux system outer membrane protein